MTTLLAFLFVLGVLIFVHELGHFLMARRVGVRVLTFSLGFGPKLLKFTHGGTEYCIKAIPLGGSVKMASEDPGDSSPDAPDGFLSKGKWQRFQILIMGPVMNLALAVIMMAGVFYYGAPRPVFERQPVVIGVFAESSPAAKAGLQLGDRVISVDGDAVANWQEYSAAIVPKAKRPVSIGFVRTAAPPTSPSCRRARASTSSGISASSPPSVPKSSRWSRVSPPRRQDCRSATSSWRSRVRGTWLTTSSSRRSGRTRIGRSR